MTSYTGALSRLREFDDVKFSGPASPIAIAELRELFPDPLPGDYVSFLEVLGAGAVGSEEFVGLGGPDHLDVRRVVVRLREPSKFVGFRDSLVPLSGDGFGNYDCIDLQLSTTETSVIVVWRHDGVGETAPVSAVGFWPWFVSILESIED